MPDQLTLNIAPAERLRFADYMGDSNRLAVAALQRAGSASGGEGLFLWGPAGVGKSHLLHAACAEAQGAIYLPLAALAEGGPDALEAIEDVGLICLDDLHRVLGRRDWEEALFHLFNRVQQAGATVAVTASAPPGHSGTVLADLRSRLSALEVYALKPPTDEELGPVLRACAWRRGMTVGDEVLGFLLRTERRDLRWLLRVLDFVERQTLLAQRPVTLPLVKSALKAARESDAPRSTEEDG